MAMDELTMLSFVGIYLLLLGNFVYNFYLSKRTYHILESIGEVIALTADIPKRAMELEETKSKGTMKRLIEEGMELEKQGE
ncbi:MAG: hypothetical protein V3T58_04910 [Candidatus Hydrothermarchaeales archaeon]